MSPEPIASSARATRESAAAALVLDRWRIKKLERADPAGVSIEERQSGQARTRCQPLGRSVKTIAASRRISDARRRLSEQIKQLQEMADIGQVRRGARARGESRNRLGSEGQCRTREVITGVPVEVRQGESEFTQSMRMCASLLAVATGPIAQGAPAKGEQLLKSYPARPSTTMSRRWFRC